MGKNRIDLTNHRYNRLLVIKEVGRTKANKSIYLCKCDCGKDVEVVSGNLRTGNTQSCGCLNLEILKEKAFYDLSNMQYGRLTVTTEHVSNGTCRSWKCLCDCGKELFVVAGDLKSGHTKSCGCLQREKASLNKYVDLKGEVFSRLTVIHEMGVINKSRMWLCKCECGNERILSTNTLRNGNTRSCGCMLKELIGEKSPCYKIDKSDTERIKGRYMIGGKNAGSWRKKVFLKDNYTCGCCGQVGGNLNAHHLDGWNWCINKRFETSNGTTLCISCHNDFHKTYGKGDNTKEQFEEYLK